MVGLTNKSYVPILRSKLGEQNAYKSLSGGALAHTKVQWVIPSRSQRDVEELRFLSAHEYVRLNGSRIGLISAGRPSFVDFRFALDGFPEGEIGQSIVDLFRTVRDATGRPTPVLDLTTSNGTMVQAISEVLRQQAFGMAFRLNAEAMQDIDTPTRLRELLGSLDVRPEQTTVLLDFENSEFTDDDDSAAIIEQARDNISTGLDWEAVVFQATSYPETNPAKKNDIATRDRLEFPLWCRLTRRSKMERSNIIFGDYGADNAAFHFDGQGRPTPHLRYSSNRQWIISRGDKKDDRHATMIATAARLVALDEFRGDGFSWGDSMVVDIAAGDRTGNPTTWRSISTSHHIEMTCRDIGELLGFKLQEYSRIRRAVQFAMDLED